MELAAPPAWNQIAHDLAGDIAALKLMLTAIGMATDEAERTRHLEMAKQSLTQGELRLHELKKAVRQEIGESSTARGTTASKARTSKSRASAGK